MTSIFELHTSEEIFNAVEREVEFFMFWNPKRAVQLAADRDGELIAEIFAGLNADVEDASDIDVLFVREMIKNQVHHNLLQDGAA